MKVLIIGANGFLGSEIARQCIVLDWDVWGAYNKKKENIPIKCKKIQMTKLSSLKINFDVIFMSAGNFTLSHNQLIDVNVLTTQLVCRLFKSAKLIFVSSIAVYGTHKDTIDENSSFINPSIYGLAKLAGEFIASSQGSFSIIRFTNLYGVGMIAKSFIPTIIHDATQKKEITLKNKERMHDYLSVQDAANLCIKVGTSKVNGTYIGATGQSISNLEVAEIIQGLTGCNLNFQETDHSPSYFFNSDKVKKTFDWNPERFISNDLKELIPFYESSNI